MIISRLTGGIGNQMFQYAAGRRLAHVLNTNLKLDICSFESHGLRKYELSPYAIKADIASQKEINCLKQQPSRCSIKIFHKIIKKKSSYIQESYFHFNPDILTLPDNIYLDGYWQSEKYFKDISLIIYDEFTLKTPLSDQNAIMLNKIQSCNAISLHIRRGDYISNKETYNYHGTCSKSYYQTCIEKIANQVDQAHFFIFSDDTEWVKCNFKVDYPMTIVDINGPDNAHEDLHLMSSCKHNIIANSSLSWWGAWLNQSAEKIAYAPKKWFANAPHNTKDLIPSVWICV